MVNNRGNETVSSIIQSSSAQNQSPNDKVKIIQSPYVITGKDALEFPRRLMERIVNNKRKINELNVDVVALKKAYTEAMQTSRQNNMQQQIIETIDISCD